MQHWQHIIFGHCRLHTVTQVLNQRVRCCYRRLKLFCDLKRAAIKRLSLQNPAAPLAFATFPKQQAAPPGVSATTADADDDLAPIGEQSERLLSARIPAVCSHDQMCFDNVALCRLDSPCSCGANPGVCTMRGHLCLRSIVASRFGRLPSSPCAATRLQRRRPAPAHINEGPHPSSIAPEPQRRLRCSADLKSLPLEVRIVLHDW